MRVVVRSWVEIPSGSFAWGWRVLECKSLRIDQESMQPLVDVVPWLINVNELQGHQAYQHIFQLSFNRRLAE